MVTLFWNLPRTAKTTPFRPFRRVGTTTPYA